MFLFVVFNFITHKIYKGLDSSFEIISLANRTERGCQLSAILHGAEYSLFDYLMKSVIITDWREPNVIRFVPYPSSCSFKARYDFGRIMKKSVLKLIGFVSRWKYLNFRGLV
jgi:kynureninase